MIIAFGKGGQVGTELARLGAKVMGRDDADLTQPETLDAVIRAANPTMVLNAAAWTAVDAAEDEEATARLVNADAPGAMARTCAELGIPLVHVSTDYVFDGSGTAPWKPDDPVAPLGAYGRTKAEGEDQVRLAGGTAVILRTSWVFSAHGTNFVKTMLRLGAERDELRIVADQIGGPTPAKAIAAAMVAIGGRLSEDPSLAGTYHFSGRADCSWADFAHAIFAEAGVFCSVEDIPSSDYPTPAPRPLNSRLDCRSTRAAFGIDRPDWRLGLREALEALQ